MGVVIEAIRIGDDWTASKTNYLLGNLGDAIDIEIDFYVEQVLISQTTDVTDGDDFIALNPAPALSGLISNGDVIYSNQPFFDTFSVGDDIEVTGSPANNGTYTITEKIDEFTVRTTGAFSSAFVAVGSYIALATPITGVRYFYNFIENASTTNFNSLIDGEESRIATDFADATVLTDVGMDFEGKKSYQIGSAMIKGRGISAGRQSFTITHNTYITPLFLADQYDDLKVGIAPSYLLNGNSLRHAIKLDAGRSLNDPNSIQSTDNEEDLLGNVGFQNENFNGGINNYFIDSYTIERVSDSETLTALEISNVVEATIVIKNTVDSPFSNNNTEFEVGFNYLPSDESMYQDNGNNIVENFLFDTAHNTVGSAFVGGKNLGTDQQVILESDATFVAADEISVRVRFSIATEAQTLILSRDLKRYSLYVSTQNHLLDREVSDRARLPVDVNDFSVTLFNADLITNTTSFIQHPYTDVADGESTIEMFPVDDAVAHSAFSIDFTGLESDGIKIRSITNEIVMTHASEDDIILETNTQDTSGSPFELGYVPFIDIDTDRIFKIPDGEIRKVISIKRDSALDAGGVFNWYVSYPFMHRWEYWVSLGVLPTLPGGIFDPLEPLNGINEFWHRYTTVAGWTINHRLTFVLEQNGAIFQQVFTNELTSCNFNSNADWTDESIKSFDVGTGSELINGSNKLIQRYVDTKVVVEATNTNEPLLDDIEIAMWIETKEKGGISDIRRSSTVYELSTNSWFKSIDSSNKIIKNKVGAVYTGEVLLNKDKLPSDSSYTIYARIYDATAVIDGKATEPGILKETEQGVIKIIE